MGSSFKLCTCVFAFGRTLAAVPRARTKSHAHTLSSLAWKIFLLGQPGRVVGKIEKKKCACEKYIKWYMTLCNMFHI